MIKNMLIRKYKDEMQSFEKSNTNPEDCIMISFCILPKGLNWEVDQRNCGYNMIQIDDHIEFNRFHSEDVEDFQIFENYWCLRDNRSTQIGYIYSEEGMKFSCPSGLYFTNDYLGNKKFTFNDKQYSKNKYMVMNGRMFITIPK
jgi:hypothetical protein